MGSQWALEQAKYNLVNEYMLVGVTEELEDFVMMLEAALPRFFRGATELYKTGASRLLFVSPHHYQNIMKSTVMAQSHHSAKVPFDCILSFKLLLQGLICDQNALLPLADVATH